MIPIKMNFKLLLLFITLVRSSAILLSSSFAVKPVQIATKQVNSALTRRLETVQRLSADRLRAVERLRRFPAIELFKDTYDHFDGELQLASKKANNLVRVMPQDPSAKRAYRKKIEKLTVIQPENPWEMAKNDGKPRSHAELSFKKRIDELKKVAIEAQRSAERLLSFPRNLVIQEIADDVEKRLKIATKKAIKALKYVDPGQVDKMAALKVIEALSETGQDPVWPVRAVKNMASIQ